MSHSGSHRARTNRRATVRVAAAAGLFMLLGSAAASAQEAFPSKLIRLIVPFPPGSTLDVVGRTVGAELATALGQPVVIDNKAGAGGTIALAELARAPADGYTIALAAQGTLVFNQVLYAKPGYDSLKDFAPIALVGHSANVLVVPSDSPYSSAQELASAAKSSPGKLTYSSGGSGTSQHLSGVLFNQLAGGELMHIPYRGAPQGVLAVVSGEVQSGFYNLPTVVAQIQQKKLKALGVTSLQRSQLLADVPSLDESGLKGYDLSTWYGFIGPAHLPEPVVQKLYAQIAAILSKPAVVDKLTALGVELEQDRSPAAFTALLHADLVKWPPVIRKSGANVD